MRLEDIVLQSGLTYKQVAKVLGCYESDISNSMTRETPRRIINEPSSFKDYIQQDCDMNTYTVKDLDWIRVHDKRYYNSLLES